MSNEESAQKSAKSGCLIAVLVAVGLVVVAAIVGVVMVKKTLTDFDTHRAKMGLRSDLVVTQEHLNYSPGMDGALWSKFVVRAGSLEEVFDTARVDPSEFDEGGYEFRVDWIDSDWWDVDAHPLTGGETSIGPDYLRVAYRDNGDGTLTVYVFWFQV
jgi:hypothetical protein